MIGFCLWQTASKACLPLCQTIMCDGGSCQVHRGIIGLRNRLIRIGNRPLGNGMVAAGRPKMQVFSLSSCRSFHRVLIIWEAHIYAILLEFNFFIYFFMKIDSIFNINDIHKPTAKLAIPYKFIYTIYPPHFFQCNYYPKSKANTILRI